MPLADHPAAGLLEQDGCTLAADLALYNESELRAELGLQTDEAGRLILEAYRRLGGDGFAAVNGDFALALWDDDAKQLILARDFAGVRPLYFALLPPGGLAFASEYKALLAIDEVAAEPDLDMVQWLQHTKHLPSGRTLLRAVRAVPPGTALAIDHRGQTLWERRMPPLELAVKRMTMDCGPRLRGRRVHAGHEDPDRSKAGRRRCAERRHRFDRRGVREPAAASEW